MGQIKVLQTNKLYYPVTGGIERVVQQLAEGLSDKTDTTVLVCQKEGKAVHENINGVPVIRCRTLCHISSLPISLAYVWCFKKEARKNDIVHIHMPFPLGDLACLLSGYKGKVVLWWHSDIVRQKRMMFFYRPLMNWLLRRADVIVVATEGHINGSRYLKPYADKCAIIPYGVDRRIKKTADDWLAKENKKSEKECVRFLFVGRLVYYKGVKNLLEAYSELVSKEPDLKEKMTLDIVGSGPLEKELHEYVRETGLQDRIFFHTKVTDAQLVEFYKKCDVFVLPSQRRSEAFGLVQIEAMAYGKPVINTWLKSGVPYVSLNGKTGLTVNPGDIEGLAQALKKMTIDKECRTRMGEAARQRVEKEYTMEKMLQKTYDLYEKLVREG